MSRLGFPPVLEPFAEAMLGWIIEGWPPWLIPFVDHMEAIQVIAMYTQALQDDVALGDEFMEWLGDRMHERGVPMYV